MNTVIRSFITVLVLTMLFGAYAVEAEVPEPLFGSGSSLAVELSESAVRRLEQATPEEASIVLILLQLMADTRGDAGERIRIGLEDSQALSRIEELIARLARIAATAPAEDERISSSRSLTVAQSVHSEIARQIGWDRRTEAVAIPISTTLSVPEWMKMVRPEGSQETFQWITIQGDASSGTDSFYELRAQGPTVWQVLITSPDGKIIERGILSSNQPFSLSKIEPNTQARLRAIRPETGRENAPSVAESLDPEDAIAVLSLQALRSAPQREAAPAALARGRYRVRIDPDSEQWVRFETEAGKIYTAETSELSGCDTAIELFEASDEYLKEDDDGGVEPLASRLSWYTTAPVTHWLRLSEVDSASCLFSLAIREESIQGFPIEGGLEPSAAEPIAVGSSPWTVVNASSDADVYLSFPVQAGKIYEVNSTTSVGVFNETGGPADAIWEAEYDAAQKSAKSYWAAYGDGKFLIQVTQSLLLEEPSLPVIRVTEAGAITLPAEYKLARKGGSGATKLSNQHSSIVTINQGQSLYAQVEVRQGDFVVIGHRPVTDGLLITSSNGVQVSEGNEIFWTAESEGAKGVEFRNLGKIEGRFLLTVEIERPYNGLTVGDEVVLHRHRRLAGEDNWSEEMSVFIGQRAKITELIEDREDIYGEPGPYLVRVDADEEMYYWRARDLKRVPE